MLRAMDSAVAGLRAHQSKLDVIGHNIANVNTYGYKTQNYSFQEAMYQTSNSSTGGTRSAGGVNAAQYGYGSLTGSISMDMTASTPTYVGGFNATISGEGFFITSATKKTMAKGGVKTEGNVEYSRVGQFLIDSNGYMVDSGGNFIYGFRPAAPAAGGGANILNPQNYANELTPLKVPMSVTVTPPANPGDSPTATAVWIDTADESTAGATQIVLTDIKINELGEVTGTIKFDPADEQKGDDEKAAGKVISLGKVALATFQNPDGLTKSGGYYYKSTESDNTGQLSVAMPGDTATATLMAGYLEASNVDLAKEFSDMITTQRGFQANTKMITVSDEVLNELVNMKR